MVLSAVNELYLNRESYIEAMASSEQNDAVEHIIDLINECSN